MSDVPSFPSGRRLKLLRVTIDASGEVHAFRDAADHDPEAWWFDLLHDPRGRVRNGPGYWHTLAARRGSTLSITCDKCGLNERYNVDLLLKTYNGAMNVREAVARLTVCDKHAKRCHRTWNLLPRNT